MRDRLYRRNGAAKRCAICEGQFGSSNTTAGEPPSAPGSAPTDSRLVERRPQISTSHSGRITTVAAVL
jgi:hypothetical protein